MINIDINNDVLCGPAYLEESRSLWLTPWFFPSMEQLWSG